MTSKIDYSNIYVEYSLYYLYMYDLAIPLILLT